MIIHHKIQRNSGAALEPCIYKSGHGVPTQGAKMRAYPDVFVPVLGITTGGYVMPVMGEPSPVLDLPLALARLAALWDLPVAHVYDYEGRRRHHVVQVEPFTRTEGFPPIIRSALTTWYERIGSTQSKGAQVVHGDPTLENYVRDGYWLDPSTRPLPQEAELDGGKLLQSYFHYGRPCLESERYMIRKFLVEQKLNLDLCIYYMLTHIIRLYGVQPQARVWAIDVVSGLRNLAEELRTEMRVDACK